MDSKVNMNQQGNIAFSLGSALEVSSIYVIDHVAISAFITPAYNTLGKHILIYNPGLNCCKDIFPLLWLSYKRNSSCHKDQTNQSLLRKRKELEGTGGVGGKEQ